MTKYSFFSGILALACGITTLTAQVTIGADQMPQPFSVLELIGNNTSQNKGMRLPQMDSVQRNAMQATAAFQTAKAGDAMGLQIFNTSTKCVETWNGTKWIQSCAPYVNDSIPDRQGGEPYNIFKWVGAFWRDNQTGERIIASKVANPATTTWTVEVDDPTGTGAWLTLELYGGSDPKLWTATPDDAENHQLPSARVTSISGTGNILFRIGAISKNANANTSYETGIKPRYATVTLRVIENNGAPDVAVLYCRQGESADYVFSNTESATGEYTGTRTLAKKFSPYNLTDADLSETVLSHKTSINGGVFVDFPTKAGAFWQWGTNKNTTNYTDYLRRAYHPTNPTGVPLLWEDDVAYPTAFDTWNEFTGTDRLETCPKGWRRFMVGDTTTVHDTQLASGNELQHSLFYSTLDDSYTNINNTNYRYHGYYADGYFDRRPVVNAVGTSIGLNVVKTAVNVNTKDVAYIGTLFTHPTTKASLFMPAAGTRQPLTSTTSIDRELRSAGEQGIYWSSSASIWNYGPPDSYAWSLIFNIIPSANSTAGNSRRYKTFGVSVRCVKE